jgi:DNA gyrase subunit B
MEDRNFQEVIDDIFQLDEGIQDKHLFKAVFLAGGPGCFDGDSLIKCEEGYKKIKDITTDDNVYTLDENNNVILKKVLDTFEYDSCDKMVEIVLENDEKIVCSPDHEIRLKDGSWKEASDLTEKDELYSI